MKKPWKKLLWYLIPLAIGTAIACAIAVYQGFSWENEFALNARYLSDGCFVSTVFVGGFGGLLAISTATDFFDFVAYGFHSILVLFTAFRNPKEHIKYYEFKQARAEKRTGGIYAPLLTGLVFLALSFLFYSIYRGQIG